MPRCETMMRCAVAGALALAAGAGAAAAQSASAPADYDAAYVGMKVPEKVVADQVFRVQVTMRNTGAKGWGSWPLRLRAMDPDNNTRWGTSYIIIRQGHTVRPGAEYTFTSNLRAPHEPGKASFQWRVCKDAKIWFGQTTPSKVITVTARPAGPATATAPARPKRDPAAKKVLAFEDFKYLGSFKPPPTVAKARGAFSNTGLAVRPMPDGTTRLFANYTHPAQVLFEMEVPELVQVVDGRHAALKTAAVKKVWGAIRTAKKGEQPIAPNGGFVWDEGRRTLYWTWYHGYKTGPAPPVMGAAKLGEDGQVACTGPWYLPKSVGLYKSYWGDVTRLPKAFADKYTGGRTLALGFGGYYSICGSASRGPALGAIAEPDPAKRDVEVTELLYYKSRTPAPRDGDYLNANCGYWAEQAESPSKGSWTYNDSCSAGAFADAPAGAAFISFARLGTGRLGYDFGRITSAGSALYWYFYDPEDLGRAAKGLIKPWQVRPAAMTKVRYPLGGTVTGAAYDEKAGCLYLICRGAYRLGREVYPVVHVYGVK